MPVPYSAAAESLAEYKRRRQERESGAQLKCNGAGRDKDHDRALCFYFNRPVTDAEMRFLDECMKRSAALMPRNLKD